MLTELLSIPERRNSIGPELINFFKRECGDKWMPMLEKFIRCFAGAEFVMPGPMFLSQLRQDECVIKSLQIDLSVNNRIKLMTQYGVTYTHLQRIWQVVAGKMLPPPLVVGGRINGVIEAARLIRRYPKQDNDIMIMYALSAKERVRAIEMVQEMRRKRTYEPYPVPNKETKAMPKVKKTTRKTLHKKTKKKVSKRTSRKTTTVKAKANSAKSFRKKVQVKKARAKVAVKPNMSEPQTKLIATLKRNGPCLTPFEMKQYMGTRIPTKTIKTLKERGLIRVKVNGSVMLTASGKKV